MKSFFIIFLLALSILALSLAGLGIKTLVLKNGELKRHCAGMDPYSGKRTGCVCAERMEGECADRKKHPYQPLDVNSNLMSELK